MRVLSGVGSLKSVIGVLTATLLAASCGRSEARADGAGEVTKQVAAPVASPEVRAPVRVLFIGTSLTAGLGLEPDSAYPARIERKADSAGVPMRAINAGLSGETSAGALRRIDWVLRDPADIVVLETGANDGLRALRVDSTRANLEAIVRRIKAQLPAARVVLVQMEAPPNLGPRYTTEFHAMFPAVAKSQGITLAPFLLTGVAGVSKLNQPDGMHPNDAGERIVAENVWRALEPEVRAVAQARGAAAGARAGGAG